MLNLFKENIKITNDNIILATPLIVFMWLSSLYISYSKGAVNSLPLLILTGVTTLFMTSAFLAGWFYMVKKAIQLSKQVFVLDTDKAKATLNLIKTIPTGIGKYFLSFVGQIIFSMLIFIITGLITFKLGMILIGNVGIDPMQLKSVLSSSIDVRAFLDTLTIDQLIKLNNWNLLLMLTTGILSFLLMLWIPEILFQTKNPLTALFKSIGKIFKKPMKSIKLFLFITILNFVISFVNTFSMLNPFIYFVMMVMYFYFLVYLVMLIFTYYDREFTEQ